MKIVIELEKSISDYEAEDIVTWLESYPAIHKATILNACGDCHNGCKKVAPKRHQKTAILKALKMTQVVEIITGDQKQMGSF